MKTQILAGLTAAATVSTALLSVSAPAQAFSFGTGGVSFDTDTTVDFTFNQSNGAYTSSLGVYEVNGSVASLVSNLFWETKQSNNGGDNGWLGTFGNAVTSSTGLNKASFTFLANKVYSLGLTSNFNGSYVNTVYTTSGLNTASGSSQQAVFNSFGSTGSDGTTFNGANAGNYQSANPFASAVRIGIDDRGNGNDKDFQDFTFTAASATTVPEPLTMGGMLLGSAGLAVARRLRRRQSV